MKTRKIIVIIVFCLVFLYTNVNAALYTSRVTDYDFVTNSDGNNTVTLTEYKGTGVINYLPEELHEMRYDENLHKEVVSKIYYPTRVLSTTFPDKTRIRDRINIPDNYIEIESGTFSNATGFKTAIVGKGITQISSECFANDTSLETVSGAVNVEKIGDKAFFDCKRLSRIELGSNLKQIGYQTFSGCIELENITFPSGITSIGKEAFYNCIKLNISSLPSSINTIGDKAFYNCNSLKETLVLPSSLTSIGSLAFVNTNVQYVKIMTTDIPQIEQDSFDGDVIFVFQEGTKRNGIHIDKGYGNYTSYEVLFGDANDDTFINSTDAAMLLDMYKNNTSPSNKIEFMKIDMDSNDIINATDAAMILDIFKNS